MSRTWQTLKPLMSWLWRTLERMLLVILAHPWTGLMLGAVVGFVLCGPPTLCQEPPSDAPGGGAIAPDLGPLHFVRPGDDKPVIDSLPAKPEPHVIIHGQGQVAVADSILPVSLELIEYSATERWVRLRIGQEYVTFDNLDWWTRPPHVERWRGVAEVSLLPRLDVGLGIAYRMCAVSGVHVGPAAVVSQHLDWGAVEVRAWRYLTNHVSVDAAIGYRIAENTQGPHLALGLGFDL